MYVCVCKAVTDSQIKHAISKGVKSRRELFNCLGVGSDCGKCNSQVKELLGCHGQNHHHKQSLMQNGANPSILAA